MKPIVIFGYGEIAEVVHFYLKHDSPYEVVAFTIDRAYIKEKTFCGLPVVPFEEIAQHYSVDQFDMIVAIGYSKMNSVRAEKYNEAKSKGYHLISYVSRKATTWPGLSVGENCIIFEDNTIQPFTKIGNNVILWSGNHIGHHAIIEDHSFISSHVVISGGVKVGNNCFIGVNATIRDHITVGNHSVIGMGAVLTKDVNPFSVFKSARSELSPISADKLKM